MQPVQLDIFEHSRDTMLRNDVIVALERHDAPAARAVWREFCRECPADAAAPLLGALIAALERRESGAITSHEDLQRARHALNREIEPAATRTFGAQSAAWLAPLWRELAQRAAPLPFHPDRCDDHAAPLWLLARGWHEAKQAVAAIASWRRIPAPLAWMTEARCRMEGLDAAWALLAELAWLAPGRFVQVTQNLADPVLERLHHRFDESFEGDGSVADLAWFPAWVLTEKSALSRLLCEAQPALHTAPEQGMRLLLELLRLERQGRHPDLIERRKALRALQPSLFAAYMATR
jgi:hypothetical protein